MQYINKTITADGFAVNFLLNNVSGFFGCAENLAVDMLENVSSEILLFAYDKGYFTLGKRIKDALLQKGKKLSCFCLDEECNLDFTLNKLLGEVAFYSTIIVIGDSNLAISLKGKVSENVNFYYFPIDFEFDRFLCEENSKNSKLIFDQKVYFESKKNKLLNGIKSVLSKRIAFIEMRVYELIGGLFSENGAFLALLEGQDSLREYFKKPNLVNLVLAQFYCSVAISCLPVDFCPLYCSQIALKQQSVADGCDLEFTFYKLLLKIYSLYFNNNINFIAQLPDILSEREQLEKLSLCESKALPDFLYDNKKVESIRKLLNSDNQLKQITFEQLNQIEPLEKTFKKIYAGRKYTVEHYGEKQRAKSIGLCSLLTQKTSALKVIWADGVLQYFN